MHSNTQVSMVINQKYNAKEWKQVLSAFIKKQSFHRYCWTEVLASKFYVLHVLWTSCTTFRAKSNWKWRTERISLSFWASILYNHAHPFQPVNYRSLNILSWRGVPTLSSPSNWNKHIPSAISLIWIDHSYTWIQILVAAVSQTSSSSFNGKAARKRCSLV